MKIRNKITSSVFLLLMSLALSAQINTAFTEGKVSYVSSQNIYVKFVSTEGLQQGDTLFKQKEGVYRAVLIVQQLSSISCVAKPFEGENFAVEELVYAKVRIAERLPKETQETKLSLLPETNEVKIVETTAPIEKDKKFKQAVWGQIKLSSYSNLSNNFTNDNQRFRYTFNLNAKQLANSRLSIESYLAFSHRIYDGVAVPINLSDLKIYTLAARYDLSENTSLWLGRKINTKIANVGAIDGLQAESRLRNFTLGAAVGSRPSFIDYSFDMNLFEFGVYAAHTLQGKAGIMENTFSIFEQKNNGKTDRRFMYFQHVNSLAKNVQAFVSFEIDMYRLENGLPVNQLSLTSMYSSLRYRFSEKLNASISYDARKNVIYYETFQNIADSILESSTRQGYRFQMNYRPFKKISVGASASYRNRPEDNRPTKNVNAYVRYAQLPFLKANLSVTANLLQTAYLDGQIYGARFDKDLLKGKLNTGISYRYVDYNFVNTTAPFNQSIAEINIDWQINRFLCLSSSYEGVFETDNQYNRIYFGIRTRF
jgi:hypothetical protein